MRRSALAFVLLALARLAFAADGDAPPAADPPPADPAPAPAPALIDVPTPPIQGSAPSSPAAPATPAPAANPLDLAPPALISDDEIEKIVVISDPFKRWDGTRWFIKTEVGLPISMTFYADQNYEFFSNAFQIRTILACDKDDQLSKHKYEVHCTVEDFAIQAADAGNLKTKAELQIAEKRQAKRKAQGKDALTETQQQRREHIQQILDEVDKKVTGASLQLQVNAMGRVTDISLEGVSHDSQRETAMYETLSKMMSRVIVGFDMKLQNYDFIEQGFWVEHTSALMSIPIEDVATQGNSMLIHRLSTIDGQLVVESRGKGVISFAINDNEDGRNSFLTSFAGVAIYDSHDAYMTERVWVMKGVPTSSSYLEMPYWNAGRIVQLKPDQKPTVGPTQEVTLPCCAIDGIAGWTAIEE